MVFADQASYEYFHSPEQREKRRVKAERRRESIVCEALALWNEGNLDGARLVLFDGGITDDGIAEYFRLWSNEGRA